MPSLELYHSLSAREAGHERPRSLCGHRLQLLNLMLEKQSRFLFEKFFDFKHELPMQGNACLASLLGICLEFEGRVLRLPHASESLQGKFVVPKVTPVLSWLQ